MGEDMFESSVMESRTGEDKTDLVELRHRVRQLEALIGGKAGKKQLEHLEDNFRRLLDGIDQQVQQLDRIRTEHFALCNTVDRLSRYVGQLQQACSRMKASCRIGNEDNV